MEVSRWYHPAIFWKDLGEFLPKYLRQLVPLHWGFRRPASKVSFRILSLIHFCLREFGNSVRLVQRALQKFLQKKPLRVPHSISSGIPPSVSLELFRSLIWSTPKNTFKSTSKNSSRVSLEEQGYFWKILPEYFQKLPQDIREFHQKFFQILFQENQWELF